MSVKVFPLVVATVVALVVATGGSVAAQPGVPLSGAIFTSDSSGAPVNLNHYADKQDVYLNGGPGINAPVSAAGLPAGVYAFQVTDPSGRTLLSTDDVSCRRVTVDGSGRFVDVTPSGACRHATGVDTEDGGITVQLFEFDDTPNNGGEYKAWLTPYADLDCGAPGNKNCFVPSRSKVDNFKVRASSVVEIDTRFERDGVLVDGLAAHWTDTLGATNVKYSEWNPAVLAFHEAHVEAAERGTHVITVHDQDGCTIAHVHTPTGNVVHPVGGTVSVEVAVKNSKAGDATYFVDVHCH